MNAPAHYPPSLPSSVASTSGLYDDTSFVAGFQAGRVDQALAHAAVCEADQIMFVVYTALLPQLGLIGRRHGYELPRPDAVPTTLAPEWSLVTFTRSRS